MEKQVPRKVLFLDVDGVLNSGLWAREMYEEHGIRVYREDILDERALVLLLTIITTTGAAIVVSSAWRQIPTAYQHLQEWLHRFGMAVFDKTPYVGGERGDDITAWFNRNPGVEKYAILDDDDDMGMHRDHLVMTDFDLGLTAEDARHCIELLGDSEGSDSA